MLKLLYNIVLHAFEVSLAASKEKEQHLQTELGTTKQMLQDKDIKISVLEEGLLGEKKVTAFLCDQIDQQNKELEMLQQKSKCRGNGLTVMYRCHFTCKTGC